MRPDQTRNFPGRRVAAVVLTAVGGAAAATLLSPSATAAPDPCAASAVAKTIATVATNTGTYLESHPQTDQALTTISRQPAGPATLGSLKTYFDANPQAAKDLQIIQQPLTSMSTRCKLPISLPQVLGLIQAAQQGGAAQAVSGLGAGAGPVPGPVAAVPVGSAPSELTQPSPVAAATSPVTPVTGTR